MEDVFIVLIIFGSGVIFVAIPFVYIFLKERLRHKERLIAIEKGILPKDLDYEKNNNGKDKKAKGDIEIINGLKTFIVGLFLLLALYITTDTLKVAIWGIFVSGIGLAKILAGLIQKRKAQQIEE